MAIVVEGDQKALFSIAITPRCRGDRLIGLVDRVFANGPGDLGSIPCRVIPKLQKCYLTPPCLTLSNIRYISRVKWSNPRKGVAPSPTTQYSGYGKGSLRVALDYGRQLLLRYLVWIEFSIVVMDYEIND